MSATGMKSLFDRLPALAEQLETPCYVYSVEQFRENYEGLKAQLGSKLRVSLKANQSAEFLQRIAHIVTDGYEVASLGELRLIAGSRQPVQVNTPCLTEQLVTAGLRSRAHFVIDHPAQIALFDPHLGGKLTEGLTVSLRINPWNYAGGSVRRGKRLVSHFGMDAPAVRHALEELAGRGIAVDGVHVFAGSYRFERDAMDILDIALQVIEEIDSRGDGTIKEVNLGGGFGPDWMDQDYDFAAYREKLRASFGGVGVSHEAGRALFASTGAFLTRVASVKELGGATYAVCDGGMPQNFLLAKTESVLKTYAEPLIFPAGGTEPAPGGTTTFVGPTCNNLDVIGRADLAARPQAGDIVAFDRCGAYNATYTVSNFLSLDQAGEYVY